MSDKTSSSKWSTFSNAVALSFGIIVTAGALFGLDQFLDYKIDRTLQNPNYIHSIAAMVRPSLIFDSKGSFLADMGGVSIISDIQFEYDAAFPTYPTNIIITPNKFLQQAPMLTAADDNEYGISVTRGHLSAWQYSLTPMKYISRNGDLPRFRLEILGE